MRAARGRQWWPPRPARGAAVDGAGAGLGWYSPRVALPAPPGSRAGCAGPDSPDLTSAGGLGGQFRAARVARGAPAGQFRRPGQASAPARRWPPAPAAATAAVSRAVPTPQQADSGLEQVSGCYGHAQRGGEGLAGQIGQSGSGEGCAALRYRRVWHLAMPECQTSVNLVLSKVPCLGPDSGTLSRCLGVIKAVAV